MENTTINKTPGPRDKKQIALMVLACAAAVAVIGLCVWFFWLRGYLAASGADPVYVRSVASITGSSASANPVFAGLVEPQQLTKVSKDDSRTVADIMVKEGDPVRVGDVLFIYDTEEMQLSIRQAELELEGIANQISTLKDQIKTLEAEKKKASKDDQYKYTVEIQDTEYQVTVAEYNRSVKQSELEKLRDSLDNAEVFSEVEGTVREVNATPKTDANGNPLPFISILSSGGYLVKGTVTELNPNAIYEGQSVIVRSRLDPETYWQGVVQPINYSENIQDNTQASMGWGDSGAEKSTKYNFYVALNSLEGLILGQHVYIEPDYGVSSQRTGLWLPAAYVVSEGGGSFVWAADENDNLERRAVLLGEYDQGEALYEIKDGLAPADYIAMPKEGLVAGGPTTTDASAQTDEDLGGETLDPGLGVNPNTDAAPDAGFNAPENNTVKTEEGADPQGDENTEGSSLLEDGAEGLAR